VASVAVFEVHLFFDRIAFYIHLNFHNRNWGDNFQRVTARTYYRCSGLFEDSSRDAVAVVSNSLSVTTCTIILFHPSIHIDSNGGIGTVTMQQ
jgi:hypothetical protein